MNDLFLIIFFLPYTYTYTIHYNILQYNTIHSVMPTKVKNISNTTMGEKVGRLHLKRQNFEKIGGRRVSALRGSRRGKTDFDDTNHDSSNGGGGGDDDGDD